MPGPSRPTAPAPRDPIWLREAQRKPEKRGLSRERIVATAIEIADREGIAAVSIRRIAGELGVRPMSLYAHFETKDDLLELMHDEVTREALIEGEVPSDWRAALRLIAQHSRTAALRHPWLVASIGSRPRLSPAILRHADQSMAAVHNLDADEATKHALIRAVDTYMLGHVIVEISERGAVDDSGAAARDTAAADYIQGQIDAGHLPNLSAVDIPVLVDRSAAKLSFEQGLDWLLDGVAVSVARGSEESPPGHARGAGS